MIKNVQLKEKCYWIKKINIALRDELFYIIEHLVKLNNCSVAEMINELLEIVYVEKLKYPTKTLYRG